MAEVKVIAELQKKILARIGAVVQERAMRLVPVDLGHLKANINFEVIGNKVRIFTQGVDYADKMEYGMPPTELSEEEKADIEDWAQRHGLKSGAGVVKGIEAHGIKVGTVDNPMHVTSLGRNSYRPFLRPALHQSMFEIKEIIREATR